MGKNELLPIITFSINEFANTVKLDLLILSTIHTAISKTVK